MKTKCCLLTLFMMIFTLSAYSQKTDGGFGGGKGMGLYSISLDIFIEINDNTSIDAYFNNDLNAVEVSIVNGYNIVFFKTNVDTSNTDNLNIDISNFVPGEYTLKFTDSEGNIIRQDDFVVEEK